MTLTSFSNPHLDGAGTSMESDSRSASTSSTDFHSLGLPLSENSEIFLQNGETLMNLRDGGNANDTPKAYVIGSNNVTIGTEFKLKIQGDTQFSITNVYEGGRVEHQRSIEDAQQKDGQVTAPEGPKKTSQRIKHLLKDRPTQFWLAGLLLALMSIISLVLFFCLYNYSSPLPTPTTFGHDDNLGDDIQVIHREEWLARPPLNQTKLLEPLKMVRIMHTAGRTCSSYQSCASHVLALQGWEVGTQEMPDIAYNYLIGGDGNVYVGRGPDVENEWQKNALDVVYLGNYLAPYDKLTDKMEEAGKRLISRLRKEGYITPDYIVVAQNHTMNTLSPGDNIYKKIKKWPHFDRGIYF